MTTTDNLLITLQAAKLAGCHPHTLRSAVFNGELKPIDFPLVHGYLFDRDDVQAWSDRRKAKATQAVG